MAAAGVGKTIHRRHMTAVQSMRDLLRKLRRLEFRLGPKVWKEPDFCGLRIDETGSVVHISVGGMASGIETRIAAKLKSTMKRERLCLGATEHTGETRLQGFSAGDSAYSAPCDCAASRDTIRDSNGTIGWFVLLDDVPVGIGSQHAFCVDGRSRYSCIYQYDDLGRNEPLIGREWSSLQSSSGRRLFDCSLVRVADPSQISGRVRTVRDYLSPYPIALGNASVLHQGQCFVILGKSRHGKPLTTTFRGVGSVRMKKDEPSAIFHEQLYFDVCTEGGDSGSVVVHTGTNTVVGLVLGISGAFTIANPLYRKRWRFVGLRMVDGVVLPLLRSKRHAA